MLLKRTANLFNKSFPQYKVYLFSIWSNAQIVDIEYPQGIGSLNFKDFFGLFAHPSIFLIKDSILA